MIIAFDLSTVIDILFRFFIINFGIEIEQLNTSFYKKIVSI